MDDKVLLSEKPTWIVIVPHLIAMCFIVGIFTIWKPLIAILTTRLTITNRRVEGKIGLIKTERMDSRIEQITSVKVTQGLIGKMFNYGTISINTAGGNYNFNYMSNPEKIRKAINNSIDNCVNVK